MKIRRIFVLIALLFSTRASAKGVVVFPLNARGVAYATADDATARLIKIAKNGGRKVIEAKQVQRRLGLDLVEQARSCNYDVFCLVEIGEILEGESLIIGHVRRKSDEQIELKLSLIDVAKVTISEVLIWRLPKDAFEDIVHHATDAAAKRLLLPKDAKVALKLSPEDIRLKLYGEQLQLPEEGSLSFWAGTYHAQAEAEGYYPKELKLVIPKGRKASELKIELEPNPLFVHKRKQRTDPFKGSTRRTGSGVGDSDAGALVTKPKPPSAFANPIAWAVAGGGVALVATGIVLMTGAQSSYNGLSLEQRFKSGESFPADIAQKMRGSARTKFRAGSAVLISGLLTAAGSVIWMIIDDTFLSSEGKKE